MTIDIGSDLRTSFGPIRDQGARPTCLVFAASDVHAALRTPWAALSCEFLFYHAQRRANRSPHDGATLAGVIASLHDDGQPLEEGWPYLAQMPTDTASWKPPQNVGAILRCRGTRGAAAVSDIVAGLEHKSASILLLTLTAAFYRPNNGRIDLDPPGATVIGGRHAVIAVGHGLVASTRYILVRNSWGARWGEGGHAWISEPYLAARLFALGHFTEVLDVPGHPAAA